MYENDRNIYKTARKSAGITQEAAAEMLGVSVESIRDYESGVRMPPNDTVDLMMIAYRSQALGLYHLRNSGSVAREILPEVQEKPLPEAVLGLVNAISSFVYHHRDWVLMAIAEDGRIDEMERSSFDEIAEHDLSDIIAASLAVRMRKSPHKDACQVRTDMDRGPI